MNAAILWVGNEVMTKGTIAVTVKKKPILKQNSLV